MSSLNNQFPIVFTDSPRFNLSQIHLAFLSFYSDLGYSVHDDVKISSGIDKSVRFIGSHISVFKPYILAGTLPNPGFVMVQNCLRTQNRSRLFDDEYNPAWGSFFTSLGCISTPNRLVETGHDVMNFFRFGLGIPATNLKLRVNDSDQDLYQVCCETSVSSQREVNTFPLSYYRHRYGIDGVRGRNFNIAIKNASDETYADVGNVIIIENDKGVLGVETALGSSTILKQLMGLDHVNDCIFSQSIKGNPCLVRKLEDAIVVTLYLLDEGLKPLASNNKDRILRSYLRSILYYCEKLNIDLERMTSIITSQEKQEFPDDKRRTDKILRYLKQYRDHLRSMQVSSKEDRLIKKSLR